MYMNNKSNQYLNIIDIIYQLSNLKQLTFEITDSCNLNCKYCGYGEFYKDFDKRENKNLSLKKAEILLDYLNEYWNSSKNISASRNIYISFYGGEPLLNMKFVQEIVQYIEQLDCPSRLFAFSMTTNVLLLKKNIQYLVEKDFNLLISLDGNEENTSYRVNKAGKSSYNLILENVKYVQLNYPKYFKKKVNFNAVLHNKNSVKEIYSYFKDNFDNIPSIGELNTNGIRKEKQTEFVKTYRNSEESLMHAENYELIEKDMFLKSSNYQMITTYLHQYSGFVYKDYNELLYGKPKSDDWITGTCMPFEKKMFVTVNGKILPCERIGHQHALGKVTDQRVVLDFEEIAQKYNNYFAKLVKQCSHCHNTKACVQCIFNLDDLQNRPVCYGFMSDKSMNQYTQQVYNFLQKNPQEYYRIMEDVIVE